MLYDTKHNLISVIEPYSDSNKVIENLLEAFYYINIGTREYPDSEAIYHHDNHVQILDGAYSLANFGINNDERPVLNSEF